ncbi:MAG: hypothetical protein KBT36_06435 [Kurthia sp.]|nr:hypothetical protein [Candidatus Kurthia equi]
MPIEHYFIRAKEEIEAFDTLMVISLLQVRAVNNIGQVVKVSSQHSTSEDFPLNNLPAELNNVEEVTRKITPEEFDHISKIYENDIKKFLYYTPGIEEF